MHIRMAWCKRTATCAHCSEPIVKASAMVYGLTYRQVNDRKWRLTYRWHPNCWIAQGMHYLIEHPYEPMTGGPGRPSMQLTDDQRTKRMKLLRRYGTIKRNLRRRLNSGQMHRLGDYDQELSDLREAIQHVGGVPKSWTT